MSVRKEKDQNSMKLYSPDISPLNIRLFGVFKWRIENDNLIKSIIFTQKWLVINLTLSLKYHNTHYRNAVYLSD